MSKATKDHVIDAINDKKPRLTKVNSLEVLNQFFDVAIELLRQKGRLELRDFGVFFVVELPTRVGRNPKTGEAVQIPAQRHVRFKMSKKMRQRLNS